MSTRRIFVYGTLLRGFPAHELMAGARFVGTARTAPAFELVDLGPYPGLLAQGATAVAGEVYDVPESLLARLDDYEGPDYDRRPIELEDGTEVEAWVLRPEHARGHARIPTGRWAVNRSS